LIIKQYDSNLYQSQTDFNPLCKELISKLKLYNKDNLLMLFQRLETLFIIMELISHEDI